MSDEGKEILKSTRKFRNYLKDIGRLLSTIEEKLIELEYEAVPDKTACAGGSASIEYPDYWFPHEAFRFFKHKNYNHILAVISVIIEDLGEPDSFTQPILSAIWFDYGQGNEVKVKPVQKPAKNARARNAWMYKFSRSILDLKQPDLGGNMIDIFPELDEKFEKFGILSSQALALPLVDIQSGRDIDEKIIRPLINSLNEKIS